MPVQIQGQAGQGEAGAKAAEAKPAEAKSFFTPDEMSLPKDSKGQPVAADAGYDALAAKGKTANQHLQEFLDWGKGIGNQLGFDTIMPGDMTEEQFDERLKQPGGIVQLAPVKGPARSAEKVNADYRGDWSKLLDIARATIAVDSVDDIHNVLDTMRKNGVEWSRQPKDRITKPPDETGYRDVMTNVTMPNGVVSEVQIHLKPMLLAKKVAHHQYETMRSIDAKTKTENRLRNAEEEATFQKALKESQQIYGEAWKKATGGAEHYSRIRQAQMRYFRRFAGKA
jgi:hypothetical protein